MMWIFWIMMCFLISCQSHSNSKHIPNVEISPTGFSVNTQQRIERFELRKGEEIYVQQDFVEPLYVSENHFIWPEPGDYELIFWGESDKMVHPVTIANIPIIDVVIQAPIGEIPKRIQEDVHISLLENKETLISLNFTALYDANYTIQIEEEKETIKMRRGETHLMFHSIDEDSVLYIESERGRVEYKILTHNQSLDHLQSNILLLGDTFPTDQFGLQDISRATDLITLQDPILEHLKSSLGLGVRISDEAVPWGFVRYEIQNTSSERHTLAIQHRIVDEDGKINRAFFPTNRRGENENGWVRTLISLPPQEMGHVQLPIFIKEGDIKNPDFNKKILREIEIYPLGSSQKLVARKSPMYIKKNSSFGLWGTFGTLFFAFLGTLFLQYILFFRLSKNHPKGFDVQDCIAIACFASVLFVSGTIAYMLGLGFAVVLGPLATMVTTIVDYLFRYPLIVTVLFISPKVGTYALFSATTWLLSGFSTGNFGLMDVIYLTSKVCLFEIMLYLMGITRYSSKWKEEHHIKIRMRFAIALSVGGFLYGAAGMALHISLYRLYYADWYITMMLLGPGFFYIIIATWVSIPFAKSISKVLR